MPYSFSQFAFAYGSPCARAVLKASPQDFQVIEQIAYPLSGEGEHLWLWVEKIGQNTDWVAKQLAQWAGISAKSVGTAGKKDRQAVTQQWISLHLPGQSDPDLSTLDIPGVRILKQRRHHRKLQTGGLSGNRFCVTLREVKGGKEGVEQRLKTLSEQGIPNYFGEQRFGNQLQNLSNASRWFCENRKVKRTQKSMYLSSVRSWIFNEILSERIQNKSWNQYQVGDVFQLQGSSKWFLDDGESSLSERISTLDIHPTGALTGQGVLPSQNAVAALEQSVIERHPLWQNGLEKWGLKQERRALRVLPEAVSWQWLDAEVLALSFSLPAGSYATMVVREVFELVLDIDAV